MVLGRPFVIAPSKLVKKLGAIRLACRVVFFSRSFASTFPAATVAAAVPAEASALAHSSHSFNKISGLTLAQAMLKQVEAGATSFSTIYTGTRQDESRLNLASDALKKFVTAEEKVWLSTRFRDEVGWRGKVSSIYEAAQARFSAALKEAESRKGIKNTGKMLIHGVEGRLNYLIKLNESPKFSEDLLSKANGIGYACVITGQGKRRSNKNGSSNNSSCNASNSNSSDNPPTNSFFGAVGALFSSSSSSSN